MEKKTGKVYLVGAGPGDPGLITQKGIQLLKKCDVVIYDRLVSDRLLDYVKEDCEKVFVGKSVGNHTMNQDKINQIILEKELGARIVVRLKGGDPFVFGRGGEEVLVLKEHGIPYEVIPGVTSAVAVAAYAGIPVTHRGISQSFHVITGHTADESEQIPEDFKALAKLNGTLIILMGLGNIKRIKEELIANGKPIHTPVAVISGGTTIWQKEVRGTLEDICQRVEAEDIKSPAIIIIGEAAKLNLLSEGSYLLSGIKVGITGTKAFTEKLSEQLQELEARVEIISASDLIEYKNNHEFDDAVQSINRYQWIVFTSSNSVHLFFQKIKMLNIDLRCLALLRFAVVGSGTGQALLQYGFHPDFIPTQFTVTSMASELSQIISENERLLIPRAAQGSEELIEILNKNKISFHDIKIYDIKSEDNLIHQEQIKQLDYITFASSSGVHSFLKGQKGKAGELFGNIKVVCIGEVTLKTLEEYGYHKAYLAKEASVTGLIERICEIHENII